MALFLSAASVLLLDARHDVLAQTIGPALDSSPTRIDFPDTGLGFHSRAVDVTLVNPGSGLTTFSGATSGEFEIPSSGGCGQTVSGTVAGSLGPNSACSFS